MNTKTLLGRGMSSSRTMRAGVALVIAGGLGRPGHRVRRGGRNRRCRFITNHHHPNTQGRRDCMSARIAGATRQPGLYRHVVHAQGRCMDEALSTHRGRSSCVRHAC